ncbi:DUF58 domain-containing protein [Halovivax cerinus]|uniref:DUF58 domain-containing protein n=1 Tax=Halovivax cerinus TaxID=1487865 RepID=A0ABD5NNN2_9EURY|nr:DUF58 domain-containing protein [Halovivax cerinus]
MIRRRTGRWNGTVIVALSAIAVGVLLAESALVLLAIPPIVFVGYSHLTRDPVVSLSVDHHLAPTDPTHGESVEVTVTVRNEGPQPLADVRVLDGVPPMLSVRDGTPRHGAVLGPGESTTFSYRVEPKHGVHRFEPVTAVVRDVSGRLAMVTTLSTSTAISCRSPVRTIPLERVVGNRPGATAGATTGSGVEFSTVRSYRFGDPPGRIDWNRYARSGSLSTVSYREERTESVVLCVDARRECYLSAGPAEPHAVLYERVAAREVLDAVTAAGTPVGLSILSAESTWLAPGTCSHHVGNIERTLEDDTTLSLEPPDRRTEDGCVDAHVSTLQPAVRADWGVVLFSPLCDDVPVEISRRLRERGCSVAVVSPDVTSGNSLATAFSQLRRRNRIATLRRADVPVVDWDPETPLEPTIRRSVGR